MFCILPKEQRPGNSQAKDCNNEKTLERSVQSLTEGDGLKRQGCFRSKLSGNT